MRKRFIVPVAVLIILVVISCGKKQETKPKSEIPALKISKFVAIEKWATEPKLQTPESVIYDPDRDMLYVSNINGGPLIRDGNGFISQVTMTGEIAKLEWVTNLNAPKGSAIWNNKLYVADIDELVEIEIETGKILNRYSAPNAKFLNDVTVDQKGNIYISDTSFLNNIIYIFNDNKISVWLQSENIAQPNGLFAEKDELIVGLGSRSLKAIKFSDQAFRDIAATGFAVDGVQGDGHGNYFISDWMGKTAFVTASGEIKQLLDTSESKINSADIEYIPSKNLLLIPTFLDNRVVAYQVE
ncbi:hypothetical protein L0Z72_08110 [candidate division KSB1 bacterium]|nr:hypothetical protein [candidate division KSB1 bacterium]